MSDKSMSKYGLSTQKAADLPMKKDFVFEKEIPGTMATTPNVPARIELSNLECIPSNWRIELTDDEDLVRVVLNSHDLVLTRQQFSKMLRDGGYNKDN